VEASGYVTVLRLLTPDARRVGYLWKIMPRRIGVGVALCLFIGSPPTVAAPRGRHVKASLVAELDAVRPGQPLVAGLRLQMEPGWHTYWVNPGDAGLPTKARWELPAGFSVGELQWPRPGRFMTGPLVSYGYEHEVLLPVEIQVPSTVSSSAVRLVARVSWLECQEVCLPGKAELELSLPVRAVASPGPAARLFEETRRRLPRADEAWGFTGSARSGTIELTVSPPRGSSLEEAYFYPVTRRVLDYSKPQTLRRSGPGYRLELPFDPRGKAVDRLEGVLVGQTPKGPRALQVEVGLAAPAATLGHSTRRSPKP
jgi:thiol:disulfide interchange protein DsbD